MAQPDVIFRPFLKNVLREEDFMRKTIRILPIIFLLLLLSFSSWAQTGGTLKGKVVDANEKFALPTVRVSLEKTNRTGVTDAEGNFLIKNIPAGTYRVTFELSGYLIETKKDVTIQAGETTELDASMRMGFAHETTVTARREMESLQKVPQNVEVLTETELRTAPTLNVVQALNNIAGVDVETGSGLTTVGTFMSINGYDDVYIKKMVDGVDVTAIVTNWSLLSAYPQEMLEQVEVVKGGSAVWGASMGGIINLVTKRPRDLERPILTLTGSLASFGAMDFGNASAIGQSGDLQRYGANIIGSHKKFGYMLGAKRDDHKLFTDFGTEKNFNLFSKFGYDFNDTTYLDFLYSYNKVSVTGHSFLETDAFLPYFPFYWNYQDDADSSSQAASLKLSSMVLPGFNLEAQLKFNRMDGNFDRIWLEGGIINGPAGTVDTSLFNDQRIGGTVKGSYNPSTQFSLVAGMDYYRIRADFSKMITDQPIIYVDSWAPFTSLEYRVGPLGLHLGARYDYDSSFGSQLSPSIGANLNLMKSTILRANVGRTFKVPDLWYTLGESYVDLILPNPDLKPERAWAYSVGFESQELQYLWVKMSLYYHDMRDGIVRVPADQEGRYTWGNATQFIRKGYEGEVGVQAPFGLQVYVSTNYNKHENKSDGVILQWIPTRTNKAGIRYINKKFDLTANLRGRWIWWNESDDLIGLFEPRDKIWMFDLRLSKGFHLSDHISLSLIVDVFNITDQLYWDRKDAPNPRRWAQAGFEVKFN
jgi:outer membrane receptor protein involved in Fe transport